MRVNGSPLRRGWYSCVLFAALQGCGSDATAVTPAPEPSDAGADTAADVVGDAGEESPSDAQADAAVPARYAALVDSVNQDLSDTGASGAAIAVVEGGMVTFSMGFGSKDPDKLDPVHATTLFRIGSSTKMMTATALLQLVQKGQVDLDASVTDYVPDFSLAGDPSWAPSIHLRHLLTHSSGMFDYAVDDWPDKSDDVLSSYLTSDAFAQAVYLMSPPGRMWNYSNPNFMLAGLITERVSGSTYRTYMHDSVFLPLGMTRTFFLGSEVMADGDYAKGSSVDGTGNPIVVDADSYDNPWVRPAGFSWSSVLDVAKFATFLMQGDDTVLSSTLRQQMQSPQIDTEMCLDLDQYGYGLFVHSGVGTADGFHAIEVVEHGGDIAGYAADVVMIPSRDFAFIALANADGAHLSRSIVAALDTLADLPAPSTPPDIAPDPADFVKYAGSYLDPFLLGELTVSTDGHDLFVSIPALDTGDTTYEPKLAAYCGRTFLVTLHEAGMTTVLPATFLLNDQGEVEYLRTREMVATRTAGSAASQAWLKQHPVDSSLLRAALRRAAVDQPRAPFYPSVRPVRP